MLPKNASIIVPEAAILAEIAWHRSRIADLEKVLGKDPEPAQMPKDMQKNALNKTLSGSWFKGSGIPFTRTPATWTDIGKRKQNRNAEKNREINRLRMECGIARNKLAIRGEEVFNVCEWFETFARHNPGKTFDLKVLFEISPYSAWERFRTLFEATIRTGSWVQETGNVYRTK